jgi:hypothetical protein
MLIAEPDRGANSGTSMMTATSSMFISTSAYGASAMAIVVPKMNTDPIFPCRRNAGPCGQATLDRT